MHFVVVIGVNGCMSNQTLWSFGTNYADSVFSKTIYKFTQGKRKYNQDCINMGLK